MLSKQGVICLLLVALLWGSWSLDCPTPVYKVDPAFKLKTVVTGFKNVETNRCLAPFGIAIDNANHLYVCHYRTGPIYRFNLNSPQPIQLSPNYIFAATPCAGLVFDGRYLWAATGFQTLSRYDLTQQAPKQEVIAKGFLDGILGMAVDSSTGDVYFSTSNGKLGRYTKKTGKVELVSPLLTKPGAAYMIDGITIDPAGKYLYGAAPMKKTIIRVDLKTTGFPVIELATDVPVGDGIGLASNPSNPSSPPYLFVATNDGKILKIDLTTKPVKVTPIVTEGSRGDFAVVGPDGCFYSTQSTTVIKVTNADGTCSLSPTLPVTKPILPPPTSKPAPPPVITSSISSPLMKCGASINVPVASSQAVKFHSTSSDVKDTLVLSTAPASVGDVSSITFSPSMPTPALTGPVDVTATYSASNKTVSAVLVVRTTNSFKTSSFCAVTFCTVPKISGGSCGVTTLTVQPADVSGTVQYQLIKDGVDSGAPQKSASFVVSTPGVYSVRYLDSRTGCAVKASNSITVYPLPVVTASVTPTTIYKGYTPLSCAQASCSVKSPTSSQATLEWLLPVNAKGASATVCSDILQAGVNTISCKATVNGCSTIQNTSVKVIDARCGPNLKKVNVCHERSTPNPHTLCIAEEAVPAHLAHGDTVGSCEQQ